MSYRKGYRFEHKVKKFLEERGYRVFRCAGSKPVDLIALSANNVYIIECKGTGKYKKDDLDKLVEIASNTIAKPLIAYRYKKNIVFLDVNSGEHLVIPHANVRSLEGYL